MKTSCTPAEKVNETPAWDIEKAKISILKLILAETTNFLSILTMPNRWETMELI